jgi:hypothetical protein
MENINMLQVVALYGFGILFLIFGMIGVITAVRFQRSMMDVEGALFGLKRSIRYFLLAILFSAITVFISDPTKWLSSLCAFVGGIIFVLLFYGARSWQLSSFQKTDLRRFGNLMDDDVEKK